MLVILLVLGSAAGLALFFLLMPGESTTAQRAPFWGVNHAHRGLHNPAKTIPENSLAAFEAAARKGYGVELDIRLTKDEQVVVFHDDDLQRMCGVNQQVNQLTFEELQALTLLQTQERIPLLRSVLDVVDSRIPLIIEIKGGTQNTLLCQQAWQVLRTYDGDFCIESFDPRILRWWKKKVPGILRGQLAAPAKDLGGLAGFAVGNLLTNFLGRPQFIAYKFGPKPFLVKLVEKFCMKAAWTLRNSEDGALAEQHYDAVIFEFYDASPHYLPALQPQNSTDTT